MQKITSLAQFKSEVRRQCQGRFGLAPEFSWARSVIFPSGEPGWSGEGVLAGGQRFLATVVGDGTKQPQILHVIPTEGAPA